MKRKVMLFLLIFILFINVTTFANELSIPSDIKGHWGEKYIIDLISKGIISGYPDGTFRPNAELKNVEFLSLILKAMKVPVEKEENLTWEQSVINQSLKIGLIKENEPYMIANNPINREQVSLIIYRVLQQREGLKEYFGQDNYLLEHMLTDYDDITDYFIPGVATVFRKGIMNGNEYPHEDKGLTIRLFNPKKNLTRAEASVIISKLIYPSKRDPISTRELEQKKQAKLLSYISPKVSNSSVYLPFENDKPVIDVNKVFLELLFTPYNTFSIGFQDTLSWDEYINKEWALNQTVDYKTEVTNNIYNSTIKAIEKAFNVSYKDDLNKYEKDLKYFLSISMNSQKYVKEHLKNIKDNKLEIESFIVTDKRLFYCDSSGRPRIKMRLYFRIKSPNKEVTLLRGIFNDRVSEDVTLKSNQWYQIDFEGSAALMGDQGNLGESWERNDYVYYDTWFLSDYIPVKPN